MPRHVDRCKFATCCQLNLTKVDAQYENVNRRWLIKLTIPATVDGQFITPIVHLCLQHAVVAWVHLRQLILVVVKMYGQSVVNRISFWLTLYMSYL